jgi:hypothetical protein
VEVLAQTTQQYLLHQRLQEVQIQVVVVVVAVQELVLLQVQTAAPALSS